MTFSVLGYSTPKTDAVAIPGSSTTTVMDFSSDMSGFSGLRRYAVIAVSYWAAAGTVVLNTPSGWTQKGGNATNQRHNFSTFTYVRRLNGTSTDGPSFSMTRAASSSTTAYFHAFAVVFTGATFRFLTGSGFGGITPPQPSASLNTVGRSLHFVWAMTALNDGPLDFVSDNGYSYVLQSDPVSFDYAPMTFAWKTEGTTGTYPVATFGVSGVHMGYYGALNTGGLILGGRRIPLT